MKRRGADVVVVAAHSGADTSSSYGDALPFPENAATLVAEQVPGIDAILVGHAHQEIAERVVGGQEAREVYAASALLCGRDDPREVAFLDRFARALGIEAEEARAIEADVLAAV